MKIFYLIVLIGLANSQTLDPRPTNPPDYIAPPPDLPPDYFWYDVADIGPGATAVYPDYVFPGGPPNQPFGGAGDTPPPVILDPATNG